MVQVIHLRHESAQEIVQEAEVSVSLMRYCEWTLPGVVDVWPLVSAQDSGWPCDSGFDYGWRPMYRCDPGDDRVQGYGRQCANANDVYEWAAISLLIAPRRGYGRGLAFLY
jgi:hypothetical protein